MDTQQSSYHHTVANNDFDILEIAYLLLVIALHNSVVSFYKFVYFLVS